MAAAISERFGVQAELVKGKNGVFDVVVDGNLVFSKRNTGRFPQDGEVLKALDK